MVALLAVSAELLLLLLLPFPDPVVDPSGPLGFWSKVVESTKSVDEGARSKGREAAGEV